MYYIIRIFFRGENESHSIESRDEYRAALTRYYNIIAADLANTQNTYCLAMLLNSKGEKVIQPFIWYNSTEGTITPPFEYAVIRTFLQNGSASNAIEYKDYDEAYKRYFNVLAADLQNENATFNMALIIDAGGNIFENRSFTKNNE